ncbi:acyltransferase family protein [Albimonas sp. CAU 1670]|uniref:acyltransferase family protein n=1 Tax=Albimonas sp. CAU 1670 TaxID=3032599 RepID=UPI0023DBEE0F|nr:acyltransferase family protein [Albimonas sp. CAU 1670]MDF2234254.1 acyltransferase family protein [Albimonas sp. CAU 1670]
MSERIGWIDAAKGIGILLVVLGHAERGLRSAGLLSDPGWALADYLLYSFHMPLFMALAGMSVPASLGRPGFVRRKAGRLLHPYLVWSLIQGGVAVALAGMTNGQATVADLLAIPWRPISPFWFLYALFVYMLVAAVAPLDRRLGLAALTIFALSPLLSVEFPFRLAYFFLFFVLGALARPRTLPLWVVPAGFAVCFGWAGAMLGAGLVQVQAGSALGLSYHSPLLLPSALAGMLATLALAQRLDLGWLRMLGRRSLSIFVMHILALAGLRIALQKGAGIEDPAILLPVVLVGGVLLPLGADALLRRLGLARWLGLGGPRPDAA